MANEISASVSCTIAQSGQSVTGSKSFTASLSATNFIGEAITVGSTTAATIFIGGLSNPSTVLIINQDTTNFITVGGDSALSQFQQKVLPGQGVLLLPETGTVYAKADTAPCQAWVVAG